MTLDSALSSEALHITTALICIVIAYFKGRRVVLWGVLGYVFSLISLVVVIVLPVLPRRYYPGLANSTMWLAERSVAKRMKEIETPDDFLREADGDKK